MLTPKQIVRMLHLCREILEVQRELPPAPPGVEPETFAAYLLPYMQDHVPLLVELRDLLSGLDGH
jgi:hypothetical protein